MPAAHHDAINLSNRANIW